MEILWPALGICAIVCVVFFALAQHWQQLLRRQSWTIQRLTDRVRELEEMDDPDFRRRLGESAPVPLEQVYNFSFRLNDHFWKHTLSLGEQDLKFVQSNGSFVGSIKLERWRSHTVATVAEILPESRAVQWQTRTLDFYPDPANGAEALNLWQLTLARPNGTALRLPSLELALRGNYLELAARLVHVGNGTGSMRPPGGIAEGMRLIRTTKKPFYCACLWTRRNSPSSEATTPPVESKMETGKQARPHKIPMVPATGRHSIQTMTKTSASNGSSGFEI